MIDGVLYKDGQAQIYTHCVCCQAQAVIKAPEANVKLWLSREAHIQDALPMLSADDRELLISGLCPKCWEEVTR